MTNIKKIRIGNDLHVKWSVFADKEHTIPYNLTDKSLTLKRSCNGRLAVSMANFVVEGNAVVFTLFGKDQERTGVYTLTLVENEGREDMHTVDSCDAFQLVARSCDVDGDACGCGNVEVESVEFTSTLSADVIANLPSSGGSIEVDSEMSDTSENPVQNKVIKKYVDATHHTYIIESFSAYEVSRAYSNPIDEPLILKSSEIPILVSAIKAGKVILLESEERGIIVCDCNVDYDDRMVSISFGDYITITCDTAITNQCTLSPRIEHLPQGGENNQILAALKDEEDDNPSYHWVNPTSIGAVPSGGRDGQILKKRSDDDFDTEWVDAPQGGGTAEGAVLYTPQTLTDEQKSQVAKNIGQPRERLILEWSNEDAEVLQPIAYDAETGYFTAETMPSWLAEDGVSVNAVINYTDAVLLGNTSSKNVVIGSDAGRSTLWIKRINETQFLCHIGQTNMTAATVPSTVDVSLFYFTNTVNPAFQLLKEGETSPTIGVRKFHIRITDMAARESKYTNLWLNGNPLYAQGANEYSKYPAAAIGHFINNCFGTTADMEVWVDYGAEGGPRGKFVRLDSNGAYFDTQQNLAYYTNPTLYSKWGGVWGFSGTKQCYLRVTALGKRATVRITEIIE